MRIGLDVDGVLYKWDLTAGYMLREVLPDSPYKGDPRLMIESPSWHYIEGIVSKEHWRWLWNEGVKLGLFRHGHLYKGAIQAVRRLATFGEIVIITHRPKQAVPDTLAWLAYQQLPISEIHILTKGEPKSRVNDLDVFLDDKPENCEDMRANSEARVGIWNRPWNQTSDFSPRIYSWQDFESMVELVKRDGRRP